MSFYYRLFDIIVPFFTWIIITLPIWLSPFHPAIVAYFILAFDLYFLYKSLTTTYFAVISYLEIERKKKVNFAKKLLILKKKPSVNHFIIIPNYKEPIYKLISTIDTIVKRDYPFENFYLVLAFEEREKEAHEKASELKAKYQNHFEDIIITYHPLKELEAPGKASNQTFASLIVEKYVQEKNIDFKEVIITICDADSHLPQNYFSYMTYEFIKDEDRLYHFYWAPVLLYNNFWQLPFFARIQATLSSIVRMAYLSQKENLIQISTYSTSLWLLKQVDYWDVDIIPEDWHIYFQTFFKFGEKIKTIPLYTIINADAVYSGKLIKTIVSRYEQEKRWAWGVTDIGYSLRKLFTTPDINFWVKLKKILFLTETHLLWPTSFFILTISASIPPLINPDFKRTVLGFLLPKLSGLILTMASFLLIFYVYLDIKLRQQMKVQTKMVDLPLLIIQWYLLPFISFVLSSLPALDAHTRLLIGKKLKYKVTEKV